MANVIVTTVLYASIEDNALEVIWFQQNDVTCLNAREALTVFIEYFSSREFSHFHRMIPKTTYFIL